MKKILFLFVLICTALYAGAVPLTVSGIITTIGTGAPVEGQFVLVLDSLSGNEEVGFTEIDGSYSIEIDVEPGTSQVIVLTGNQCPNSSYTAIGQISTNPAGLLEATVDFEIPECVPSNCVTFANYQLSAAYSVTFTGEAFSWVDSNATFTYSWDFGDSTTGTGSQTAHTYAQPGTYTVTLTATSADCEAITVLTVEVVDGEPFTISGTVVSSTGDPIEFWPVSVLIPGSNGNYVDGFTDQSGSYSITVFIPDSTEYVVASSYTFCDPSGNTEYDVPVIGAGAIINFVLCDSFPQPESCYAYISYTNTGLLSFDFEANLFSATNSPFVSYSWDFGDGGTSTEASPSHSYNEPGVYTVLLEATTADGCVAHACEVVFAFDDSIHCPIDTFFYGCQALFFAEYILDSTTTFNPTTFYFESASYGFVVEWNWDFGDGNTSTDGPNVVHTYADTGVYEVTLHIVTIDGCESDFTMHVYAGDYSWLEPDCQAFFIPFPDSTGNGFFFEDLSYSQTPIQSWTWDFGDGNTSTEQNPFHIYDSPGIYNISLTIQGDSCESYISFELDTDNPFNQFGGNGAFGLSSASVSTKEPNSIPQTLVAPNPVTDRINVAFESIRAQPVTVRLVQITGQVVRSTSLTAQSGWNSVQMQANDLAAGMYYLQIQGNKDIQTVKIVKVD